MVLVQQRPASRSLMARVRRIAPAAIYLLLALAIAGPLLAPGCILLPDLTLTPHPAIPSAYYGLAQGTHEGSPARLPLDALFTLLGHLDAVQLGEKLMLLAIVFLAGLGMHRLVRTRSTAAALFAGLLYAVNPFVYDRLDTGQWYLLLGYALIPWAFAAFRAVLENSSPRAPWVFAALFLATAVASTHMVALLALLCLTTILAWLPRLVRRQAPVKPLAIAATLAILPSLYWLIPTPGLEDFWSRIGSGQLALYRTVPDPHLGLLLNVTGLYGYWNNDFPVKSFLSVWPAFAVAMPLIALAGAFARRRDPTTWAVLAAAALGLLLALGDASGVTRPVFSWALEHFSALRSFRESQKAAALLAFGYAYLGAAAVDDVLTAPRTRRRTTVALALAAIAFPLIAGYRLFDGLSRDLRTSHFPASWSQADTFLRSRARNVRTLFLPWHGYFALSFAHQRVVGNLAPAFFHTPVLASRAVGDEPALNDTADPTEAYVRRLLAHGAAGPHFAGCLAPLGVRYILLAHQTDWHRYSFLDQRPDVTLVRRWPDLTLYRVHNQAGLVMSAPPGPLACSTPLRSIAVQRQSPVRYRLGADPPPSTRLVYGLPQSAHWRLAGAQITFTRWPVYRRNYLLGLAGLLVAVGSFAVTEHRRRRPS